MSGSFFIPVVVIGFLILGFFMHRREKAKIKPVFDAVAKKYGGNLSHPFLGMPQLVVNTQGSVLRITAMSKSLDTPQGGGKMTCVDFDIEKNAVGDFRVQEKSHFKRTAVPRVLMGQSQPFTTGMCEFDSRFASCASNATQADRILKDPSVSKAILAMPHGADIRLQDGRCYISVDGHPQDVASVDRLIFTAECLIESLAA